jgi:hypothetical protein
MAGVRPRKHHFSNIDNNSEGVKSSYSNMNDGDKLNMMIQNIDAT